MKHAAAAPPAASVPQTPVRRQPRGDAAAPGAAPEARWEIRYDSKRIEFDAWLEAFSDRLTGALQGAPSVFARTGHVTLSLRIRQDGSLGLVTVARSSGVTALGEGVRAAVAAMAGVPLPQTYPAAAMAAEVTVYVNEPAPEPPKP